MVLHTLEAMVQLRQFTTGVDIDDASHILPRSSPVMHYLTRILYLLNVSNCANSWLVN